MADSQPSEERLPDLYRDLPDFGPIPEELRCTFTDGPFTQCSVCGKPLVDVGIYEIQKVFRAKECVFELAMCHGCLQSIASEYSEESKDAITEFHMGICWS